MKLVRAKKGYRKVGDKYLLAKKCTVCGRWLVASTVNFHRNKGKKYGLRDQCKECVKEYGKQYRNQNRDKIKERRKEYYEKNRDARLEYQKEYHKQNRDAILERTKEYRKQNRDAILEYQKEYYEKNRDAILEYQKEHYKENRDAILEYQKEHYKEYYNQNRDKINEKRRRKRIDAIIAQKRAEYEAERAPLVAEKTCRCCGRTLPASEFYANKKSKDHLGSYCKECHKKKGQETYYHNLETKGWA